MPPTADEWRRILIDRCRRRQEPFDGRQQDLLLGFGLELARTARGSRVALARVRDEFGDRLTRRYIAVLTHHDLVVMVVKPARGRDGKPGKVAVYEFRHGPETLPASPHKPGSVSCDLSGQRFRTSDNADERDDEPERARTLPGYTLKASRLYSGASRQSRPPVRCGGSRPHLAVAS